MISEDILKSIAATRGECTMQYENIASHNTKYIVPDFSDFFRSYWKGTRKRTEKRIAYICEKNTD